MAIKLISDGTLDTVLTCTKCGENFRSNFASFYEGLSDDDDIPSYDEFVDDMITEAEADHECNAN